MALINIEKQFDNIKQSALDAVKTIFPVSRDKHELILNRVWVEDKLDVDDFANQAKVKEKGGSWGAGVYVDLTLRDKGTRKALDREKKIKLFMLPKLTHRASYIVKGNEYQVANQLRLKSGAYVKQMKGGGFKTQINLAKGGIKPEIKVTARGILKLNIRQANIPLLPLLLGMGVPEDTVRTAWGKAAYEQNLEQRTSQKEALRSFAEQVSNSKSDSIETSRDRIKNFIETKTEILPEMTKLTLGTAHSKFTPAFLLDASTKLINVQKGDEEPDDVDNLAYKEFFGVDDSIKERIEKNKNAILYKINRNLDSRMKIRQIITIGTFGNLIESFFTSDDRSATPEQVNPLHMYAGHEKITFLGPGSISSTKQVTDDTQNVHPTHFSYLDPVHTPEGDKIGLNLGLTIGAEKVGKDLKSTYLNIKTGKAETLSAVEVYNFVVAYPDQYDIETGKFKSAKVKGQKRGKFVIVPKSKVDYVMPFAQGAFSLSTNMIPFIASDNGNRTMMAGKHMEQAISLKDREAPLVQSLMPGKRKSSFEEMMGSSFSVYATVNGAPDGEPISGTVKRLTKDAITIQSGRKTHKINLYNNFVLNQKTFITHEPKVQVGDKVKGGQLLADSNYTKDGTLSLGRNLRTAYIPYKGYNFEDGIVITETAAKKLTSEHIHRKEIVLTKNSLMNLSKFLAHFPNDISIANREKLDEYGIAKKGTKIAPDDVVIAILKDTGGVVGLEAVKATFDKSLGSRFKARIEKWTSEHEGIVTGAVKGGDKISVFIKTDEPAKIGDKLAGRHGNKGIITKIIPDAKAPHDKDGDPIDIMLNPHGVVSRINIGQMYESAAAKAAKKKGKKFKVQNFSGENYLKTVKDELKSVGMEDTEELTDPETGKTLGKVHVGNPYILKLNKQSTVNFSVRGESGPVSKTTLQPAKGGSEGAKAVDPLTLYSMLSHGARANLQEMTTYKSENNPEFWEALKFGRPIPAPKSPFVFEKLVSMLHGAGVDVRKEGSKMYLAPLTDAQIKKMSKMEITNPAFIRASGKKIIEEKGGFLDPVHLGGAGGDGWSHIKLKEELPNPIFEDAIKSLLGLVKADYQAIISGEKEVDVDGKKLTAGKAIKALLSKINIDKEIAELEPQLNNLKGTKLNNVLKRYRLLQSLKDNGFTPAEAYMKQNVAVLPPKFRPISAMDSGDLAVDDANILYRNVAAINKQMNLPVVKMLDDEDLKEVRGEMYTQMKALAGLESVKVGGRDKIGFLDKIHGAQPKSGFYQYKVLRKNQNLVGRGTIIPEPRLHMNQVALPEEMAWKLYAPFILKELVHQGMMAKDAKNETEQRTPRARKALETAIAKRPVILNRAPSLHKFSMMAFQPQITQGKAIKIPPLVVTGFNADFDGDTMTVHVPLTDKAVRESYKMMPSRNLYKPGTGALMVGPSQESQLGFYLMTKNAKDRAKLNALLPKKFHIKGEMNKGASKGLFLKLSKSLPNDQFSKLIDTIKIMGENAAYEKGFSLALKDLKVVKGRDKIIDMIMKDADQLKAGKMDMETFTKKITGSKGYQAVLDKHIQNSLQNTDNALYEMYNSGARGSAGQVRQIVASPLVVQDPQGKLIPNPIGKSFTEGLDMSDYWIASYGARKGMIDKSKGTQEPGVFNKALMSVAINNVVSTEDCGTKDGVHMSINSPELYGRFLQGKQGGLSDETIVDEDAIRILKKKKVNRVFVRSPLKCKAKYGTCRHCYGVDENGQLVGIGDNIGTKAGQALAEPLTQMTLNTFHSGGAAGSGRKGGYARIKELMDMPKNIKVGKAILADDPGIVEKVEASGLGGFNVYIRGKKYVTQPGMKLKVKRGDTVKRGDPLSEGSIAPQELLQYKGMSAAQDYLTDELKDAYGSQGIKIERKTFETVVRSMTNRTKIINNAEQAPFLPGESIPYHMAEDYNAARKLKNNPTEKSKGLILSKSVAGLDEGLKLSNKEIKMLKGLGISNLDVEMEELRHEPYLKGVKSLPLNHNDWMAQMGAHHIKDAIINGASQGWMSDTKDYHPIPAFAYGATFGEGEEGRY